MSLQQQCKTTVKRCFIWRYFTISWKDCVNLRRK